MALYDGAPHSQPVLQKNHGLMKVMVIQSTFGSDIKFL
jgi:hypothetical protein